MKISQLTYIDVLLLLATSGYLFLVNIEASSFGYRDENFHVLATQSMLESGKPFHPMLFGEPYIGKPPFKMWLSLIPISILGESNFSYRILDAVLGIGTIVLVYLFSLRLFSSRIGSLLAAFLMMGSSAYVLNHGPRIAVQDSMFVFLSLFAFFFYWRGYEKLDLDKGPAKEMLVFAFLVGLAFMTKSLLALLIPVIILLHLLLSGKMISFIKNHKTSLAAAFLLMVAIPLPYFLYHSINTPFAARGLLAFGALDKVAAGDHHPGVAGFYFLRIFRDGACVDQFALTIGLLFAGTGVFYRGCKLDLFLLIWIALPILVFTATGSRLTWYIALSFPAMAIVGGEGLSRLLFSGLRKGFSRWAILPLGLFAFAFLSSCGKFYSVASHVSDDSKHRLIPVNKFVRHIQKDGKMPAVFAYSSPEFSRRELVYFNMLRPIKEASSLDIETVKEGSLIITELKQAAEIYRLKNFSSYYFLKPTEDRNRWIVALYFGHSPKGFKKTERTFSSDRIKIRGDYLWRNIGGELLSGAEEEIYVSLNGQPIGALDPKGKLHIDSGLFKKGDNLIELSKLAGKVSLKLGKTN